MKRNLFITLFLAVPLLAGCPHKKYTLKLSTDGRVLHRTLTIEGPEIRVTEDELAAVEKTYGRKPKKINPTAENNLTVSYTFTGSFQDKTPDDIGGNGSLLFYTSPMGSTSTYIETFRGTDDIAAQMEARLTAINRAVEFLRAWMRCEFGTMEDFDKLDAFLDCSLRADAKNLVLYLWLLQNRKNNIYPASDRQVQVDPTTSPTSQPTSCPSQADEDDPECTIFFRMIQYVLERNYIPLDRLPAIFSGDIGILSDEEPSHRKLRHAILSHVLTTKAGLPPNGRLTKAVLQFFDDPKAIQASILAYIKTTPEYKKLKQQIEADAATQPSMQEIQPGDVGEAIANSYLPLLTPQGMIVFSLLHPDDELIVELQLTKDSTPLVCNGHFDSERHVIRWSGSIAWCVNPLDSEQLKIHVDGFIAPIAGMFSNLPGICYADWTTPDEVVQRQKFGKVVLTDGELMNFVQWTNSITKDQAEQFQAFFRTLNAKNIKTILTFRFRGQNEPAYAEHDGLRILYRAVTGENPPEIKKDKP